MKCDKNVPIKQETSSKQEIYKFRLKDPLSFLTHFIAFLASIFMMPVLLVHMANINANLVTMIGLSIFMISMTLLYGASSIYHAFDISSYVNKVLKKIDHMMIFVLIAGSYTPICLTALKNHFGKNLLIFIWVLAVMGMILKYFWVTCPKWFSSIIYIAMGWSCIVVLPQIFNNISVMGFLWLLAGGIVYTIGGIIYSLKPKKMITRFKHFGLHEVFHIFVMMGSMCHYIVMYNYLPI